MTEQEAIISHIEECKHRISVIQEFVETNKDADVKKCERNIFVLNNAIKTLEKQIAKKPIDCDDREVWYLCPTCKGDLTKIRSFYCAFSGQKLDWGNEDAE